jgi:hypothetical protein
MFLIVQRPYIASTIFVVDMLGNTTIIDVWAIETIVIDLEVQGLELLLLDILEAWYEVFQVKDVDDVGFSRDCQPIPDNVIPFGDYRACRFEM